MNERSLMDYARRGADLRVSMVSNSHETIRDAASEIVQCFRQGGKLLIFGNGGSAADAQHVAAELVARFKSTRRAFPALALTTDSSVITSIANDFDYSEIFARQIEALGRPGDVALAISTSGKSKNVLRGLAAARNDGLVTIGLTGRDCGPMMDLCKVLLAVPESETSLVQETHLMVEHMLCGLVEEGLAQEETKFA